MHRIIDLHFILACDTVHSILRRHINSMYSCSIQTAPHALESPYVILKFEFKHHDLVPNDSVTFVSEIQTFIRIGFQSFLELL